MNCIDFDSRFTLYLRAFLEAHQDEYEDIGEIERLMPQLYARFASEAADDLGGLSPQEYFDTMGDAAQLVGLMKEYVDTGVSLPDLLPERILALGAAAEEPLIRLLTDVSEALETRLLCVRLLQDIGSTRMMETYVSWQTDREEHDDLADLSLESLEEMGEAALPLMLEALEDANEVGREALLSVLSRYPGHEEVYNHLIRLFDALPERQAILAAYLGRLGDARALPVLMDRANEEGLKYLDYIELRAAIEELGGEAPVRRFDEDPEYDALMGMDLK